MAVPTSFREVIELWPTHAAMSEDTGAPATSIPKWSQRNRIPSDWWSAICATEIARSAGVDAELLTRFAAREVPVCAVEARV